MQSLQNLSSWSVATTGVVPKPLVGPSITLSPLGRPHPPTVFLFGGRMVHTRRMTADMYALNLDTMVWTKLTSGEGQENDLDPARSLGRASPEARYFHSMDVWEDKLVLFGGMTDTKSLTVLSDVWFFDCAAKRWLPQMSPRGAIGLGVDALGQAHQETGLLPQARYAHLSSVSRGKLLIVGGQHVDNTYVYEINVFDLKTQAWVSKTPQAIVQDQNSNGAYRAIAVSSKYRTVQAGRPGDTNGSAALSYTIEEDGGGGDICCYSNYEFAAVRRELELLSPQEPEQIAAVPVGTSAFRTPPGFSVQDITSRMAGASLPPGLRFPTGGLVGPYLVLSGLYLASSAQSFSVWALHLETLVWKRLEAHALASGSWNRAITQPLEAKLLVFGNKQASLAEDYGRRAINVDHVSTIALETFGIYQPPMLEVPSAVQEMGLTTLDEKLASDFEVICDDGRKVRCSREMLRRRWPWFADEESHVTGKAVLGVADADATTAGSSNSPHVMDTLTSFTPARLTPRQLHLPEPFPVCVAFVQFLYTLSLVTPLQLKAPVLSSLLFLAKRYQLERLAKLVVHALHERLDRSIALGVYEIATLCGERELQVRALKLVVSAKSHSRTASSSSLSRGPSASVLPTPPSNQDGYGTNLGSSRSAGTASSSGVRTPAFTPMNPALQMALANAIERSAIAQDADASRRESETLPPDGSMGASAVPAEPWSGVMEDHRHALDPLMTTLSLRAPLDRNQLIRLTRSHDALRPAGARSQDFAASLTLPLIDSSRMPSHPYRDLRTPSRLVIPDAFQTDPLHLQQPSPTVSDQPSTTPSAPPLTPSDFGSHRDRVSATDDFFDNSGPRVSPQRPPRDSARAFCGHFSTGSPYPPPAFRRPLDDSLTSLYRPGKAPEGGHCSSAASESSIDRRSSNGSVGKESCLNQTSPSLTFESFETFGHHAGVLSSQDKVSLPIISDEYHVVIGSEGKRGNAKAWSQSDQTKKSEAASIRINSTTTSSMNPKTAKNMAKLEKAERKAAEQRLRQARMQQEARARMLEFQIKKNEELVKTQTATSAASSDKSSNKVKKTKKKFAAMWKATMDAAAPTGGPM